MTVTETRTLDPRSAPVLSEAVNSEPWLFCDEIGMARGFLKPCKAGAVQPMRAAVV
jgi:hypothetical protein